MNVIMRNVIMPECCNNCVCSAGYGCGKTGTTMTTEEMKSRPDWCPLEEVELCEDAVSREDAIRWVKTECNPYGKPTLDFESGKKVIEYLKRMSPVAPKAEQRWIPCSERLPEKEVVYIITVHYDDRNFITFDNFCSYKHGWKEWSNQEVLAWMPLPEAYRGEQNETD
jgi:hypothetical protein